MTTRVVALGATLLLVLGAIRAEVSVPLPALVASLVVLAAVVRPAAGAVLAGIGWLTVLGFTRAPYAQLTWTGTHPVHALAVCALAAAVGSCLHLLRPVPRLVGAAH